MRRAVAAPLATAFTALALGASPLAAGTAHAAPQPRCDDTKAGACFTFNPLGVNQFVASDPQSPGDDHLVLKSFLSADGQPNAGISWEATPLGGGNFHFTNEGTGQKIQVHITQVATYPNQPSQSDRGETTYWKPAEYVVRGTSGKCIDSKAGNETSPLPVFRECDRSDNQKVQFGDLYGGDRIEKFLVANGA
ncbi:hypothetical protein [Streptomyces sp. NPDC048637]|uniref:hypothetical protein n=1 Tax=Streptomyces sp. NPDC048637 TaxID=3155636 RepID=UPI003431E150